MGEFHIRVRVGNIAAGRDVEIMELDITVEDHMGMARIALQAPVQRIHHLEGNLRQNGDAVIGLHAVEAHMRIAQRLHRLQREQPVLDLDFLQADDIGTFLHREPAQKVDPQPQRIDVPGGNAHGDSVSLL